MCKFVVSMIICLNGNFHYNGCDLNKRGVVWAWSSFVTPLLKSLPTPLGQYWEMFYLTKLFVQLLVRRESINAENRIQSYIAQLFTCLIV